MSKLRCFVEVDHGLVKLPAPEGAPLSPDEMQYAGNYLSACIRLHNSFNKSAKLLARAMTGNPHGVCLSSSISKSMSTHLKSYMLVTIKTWVP